MQASLLQAGVHNRPLPIRARPCARRQLVVVAGKKRIVGKESRIGCKPISIPTGLQVNVEGQTVTVKNTKGLSMSETLPNLLSVETLENGTLRLRKLEDTRKADQVHGLFRSLTNNMMLGLSEGFKKEMQLVGVGYRAFVDGDVLTLSLGFSHPVVFQIPEGIKATVVRAVSLTLEGHDKVALGDFAAKIRSMRKPEPYKGKGIKYVDEVIRRKEGKRGKK
mmetsp:Transcript_6006/g.17193  ORF Transcript_6006/g.17193 Transcript_6006/m.17193 type:complete len:221 (+) Transcript_6006:86-748(+)|eukprot:CAMPEP_0206136794 /NCGR_PEP_ID=MMETSP1473-20131121/2019_1 /ASSEMBLY_ACC=CAM_ASM_001109 /TAXON_ID=1461547 /ORGANISM="Stichococcus sp, Strain RCC1054" /LENGTH=220 /DNA_ID=CAMNT_0053529577 /DNA_START=63 /DNA_END=725 /DNA_ORIENTATION=+